jgi:hypothetical protein
MDDGDAQNVIADALILRKKNLHKIFKLEPKQRFFSVISAHYFVGKRFKITRKQPDHADAKTTKNRNVPFRVKGIS